MRLRQRGTDGIAPREAPSSVVRQLDGILSLSPDGSGTSFDISPPRSVLAA